MSTIDLHLRQAQQAEYKYEATLPVPDPEDPQQMMLVMVYGNMDGVFTITQVVRRYNGETVPEQTWRSLEQNLLKQLPEEAHGAAF